MWKRTLLAVAAVALLAVTTLHLTVGAKEEDFTGAVFQIDGIALRGYDPVAYFEKGEPVKGTAEHEIFWHDAIWRFESAKNRSLFEDDPEKYAPQYGGYCAWAVAEKGEAFATDPNAWRIVDDKLYLNYDANIQTRWEKDIPGFIREGDEKWPRLMKDLAVRGS